MFFAAEICIRAVAQEVSLRGAHVLPQGHCGRVGLLRAVSLSLAGLYFVHKPPNLQLIEHTFTRGRILSSRCMHCLISWSRETCRLHCDKMD